METKKCRVCRVERKLELFHKHTSAKDGRRAYCRYCASQRVNHWRKHGTCTGNPYEKFSDRKIVGLLNDAKMEIKRRGLTPDQVRSLR